MSTKSSPITNGVPAWGFSLDTPDSHENIGNDEFLLSYLRFGVWMRYALAYEQVLKLRSNSDPFDRMCATAAFYTAFGALLEDVTAMLVSWMVWESAPDSNLADTLYLTSLRKDTKAKPSVLYVDKNIASLVGMKATPIDIGCFAESLNMTSPVEVLKRIGIDWKRIPSVKMAKSDRELIFWSMLPKKVEDVLERLTNSGVHHLRGAYNKIKHGPQLTICDLAEHFRGHAKTSAQMTDNLQRRGLSPETLRILFRGSDTRLDHATDTPCTICLDDDFEAVGANFGRVVHPLAKNMYLFGSWIARRKLGMDWQAPPRFFLESERLVEELHSGVLTRRAIQNAKTAPKTS